MRKLFKNKYYLLMICAVVCFSIALVYTLSGTLTAKQNVRDINLKSKQVDVQSILNKFSDVEMDKNNERILFEGTQKLDPSLLREIDNLSGEEANKLKSVDVRYSFKYDMVTNTVTLKATMYLPDGTVKVDTITGVGFINDANEIDAMMNVDGEGVLLSEMRNAGLIDNVGWFSRVIKKIAKVVAVVAVTVAAVAAVVATAGAAAPAVVAAGIGVATTVVSSAAVTGATIAGVSLFTAGVAAGVYVVADRTEIVEFLGKTYICHIIKKEELYRTKGKYHIAKIGSDDRLYICPIPVAFNTARKAAKNFDIDIYTFRKQNAAALASSINKKITEDFASRVGYFDHYHARPTCEAHFFFGFPRMA